MRKIYYYTILFFTLFLLTGCFFNGAESQRWSLAPEGATAFALSADGRFALYYSKKQQLSFWDLQQNRQLAALGALDAEDTTVFHIEISDNNRFAITSSQQNFAIWDLGLSQSTGLWSISDGVIRSLDISNNGTQVLLGLSNGKAIYVDLVTGRRLEFLAHQEKVNSVSLSANGKYALSGGDDKFAYLWDTTSGQIINTFKHKHHVNQVALQGDGKLAFTADGSNQWRLWSIPSGKLYSELTTFARGQVFSISRFSHDGKQILTGTPAGLVMLWDAATGDKIKQWKTEPLKDSRPATAVVYDVAIDSQQRVISATSAGIAQAWLIE
jgi:WD40 repeat protein